MEVTVKKTLSKKQEFMELVTQHHRELLVYTRTLTGENHLSQDIAQESFVVAWNNYEKFDITKNFGSWLRGIVRNKWKESLRKNSKITHVEDEVLDALEAEMQVWDQQSGSIFEKLEGCLTKLPEQLLKVIKSYYYDGLKTEEIASTSELTGGAVRKRLERARVALKECINK